MVSDNNAHPSCDKDLRKDALTVLSVQMQTHERYHTQKENMTWLVAVAYVGAAAFLVGHKPFWEDWPIQWLEAWLVLLLITAVTVIYFVHWQFVNRNIASVFFTCCNDAMVECLYSCPTKEELLPVSLRELDGMSVPAKLGNKFRDTYRGEFSWPQILTLTLVVLWTIGAGIYVMLTYRGLCGL